MGIQQLQEHLLYFRVKFADRPFWLFVGLFLACAALLVLLRRRTPTDTSEQEAPAITAALLAIATYVAMMLWYLWQEPYYDFAEPTIAAVGWMFHLGHPVYHASEAAERYAHVYGPLAFMIPGWFLASVGPSIFTSKAVGVLSGLLGLAVIHRTVQSATGRRNALLLTGVFALLALTYGSRSFWLRPDSLLLLFTSVGLLAATWRRQWLATIGVGVGVGVLLNLKITGLLYALPAFGLLMARFGVLPVAIAAGAAVVTALLPFVAFDNVSLENYLLWIGMSAKNGLLFTSVRQNVEWALFLLIPLAPTLLAPPPPPLSVRGRRWLYGSFLVGLAGAVVAASKPGAGSYHLMQFWPFVVYAVALHLDALPVSMRVDPFYRAGRVGFLLVTMMIAFTQQVHFVAATKLTDGVRGAADLTEFVHANPDRSIAMGHGYGDYGERLTYLRPLLVFKTGQYVIDVPAVQEYQMSGIDLPRTTIDAVRRCNVDMWLFPHGAKPFDAMNRYPMTGYVQLFPEPFKQAFFAHYDHTRDTRYFQVWSCREPAVR